MTVTLTTFTVALWDPSPDEPRQQVRQWDDLDAIDEAPDDTEFGGWGLGIVAAEADACGVTWLEPKPHQGKWVWASFEVQRGADDAGG